MQRKAEPPAKALRTPRAAGAAGVLSALLLGGAMIQVRRAVPESPLDAAAYLADTAGRTALQVALLLLPFGGVFFLWFMGAVRDSFGMREDRFFATVFLGAGFLYVGMLFVFGATATGFMLTIEKIKSLPQSADTWHYGRYLTIALLTEYAPRMAGVFALTTTTIGTRLGILPRWLSLLGYLVGLALLLLVGGLPWVELAFPVWVLIVGVFLIVTRTNRDDLVNP
ncbi:hypothetical protein [Thermoactinospora rubra]|uniref:hypothetical protein n=1 Tax=Thermoactinospora rubra TaxID=1088767 RepID=UPI000A1114C6|nr:hypothetical protein [Thermoactinospora rubra]